MSGTTDRLSLPYPGGADGPDGADVPYWMQALAESLDGAAIDSQGVLADRPSPEIAGRYYMVEGDSDTTRNGILWRDNGSGWEAINVIPDGAVTTAKLAAKAVTSAKIADALKPSAGAANGTEALRAIGSGTGQVAAGNDARLTGAARVLNKYVGPLAHTAGHDIIQYVFPIPGGTVGAGSGLRFRFRIKTTGAGGGPTNDIKLYLGGTPFGLSGTPVATASGNKEFDGEILMFNHGDAAHQYWYYTPLGGTDDWWPLTSGGSPKSSTADLTVDQNFMLILFRDGAAVGTIYHACLELLP